MFYSIHQTQMKEIFMRYRFNCIEDVAGYFSLIDTKHTLEDLVDRLVDLCFQEHVYAFHGDLGLKHDLPQDLLRLNLEDVFELEYQGQRDQRQKHFSNIVDDANYIIHLYETPVTEERQRWIDEDKMERGEDDD